MVPPTTEPMSEAESPAAEPNLVPHSEDELSFTPYLYTPNFTSITHKSCPCGATHNHPTTPDRSTHSPLYPIPMSALDSSPTSNTTTNTSPPPNKYKSLKKLIYGPTKYLLPHALTASINSTPTFEPINYTQAIKHPHWQSAMQDEYDALLRNHTWSLVPAT